MRPEVRLPLMMVFITDSTIDDYTALNGTAQTTSKHNCIFFMEAQQLTPHREKKKLSGERKHSVNSVFPQLYIVLENSQRSVRGGNRIFLFLS